jgi:oligoendopeptidase F
MGKSKLPLRNEVTQNFKWKLEDLYDNTEAWKQDYDKLKASISKISSFKDNIGKSSDSLLECLKFNDEISKITEKVYVYANMKLHEDTSNALYQGLADQAQSLMVNLSSASSFIIPEILSIEDKTLAQFIASNNELNVYTQYLNNITRQKSHVLSPQIEEILAQAGDIADAADNIFSMFNNADIKFADIKDEQGNDVELTKGRYVSFLESNDARVRHDAFEALYSSYSSQKNTLAATFSANVKKDSFFAKVRKYSSSLEAALDNSNIPMDVYTNLIDTVHKNMPIMHRYVSVRKKLLGLDELHMYDLYAPMVKDVDMKFSYDMAKQKVVEGLSPMGEEYLSILKSGYENGWIDVYENQGKRSGAYSWGAYGTHPYVLLNHEDNLNSVFTLAHEMGHAMHSYYSDATQPYIYAGYKIFVAEVASTVNEALLMDYMIKNTDEKYKKAYLINHFLEQFRGTLFRQTMFAEFEMITHNMVEQGEALTVEALCSIYHKLNETYFGSGITIDAAIDMEWARIPHFYNAFYVYQYATGYSAAIALSQKIIKEGKPAVDAYTSFLKGGSSDYPINLLKKAGVDMTTAEPIEKALKVFEQLLDQIETLLS